MSQEELTKQAKAKKNRQFRRIWIPVIRKSLGTIADIGGDWFFYSRVRTYDVVAQSVVRASLIFSIVSTVLGGFTAIAFFMHRSKSCTSMHNVHKHRFETFVNYLLASEIFIEDIPQFILSYVIFNSRFGMTPEAVFNATTTAFNFMLKTLDILTPLDEEEFGLVEIVVDEEEGTTNEKTALLRPLEESKN
jgi:hypothetical protein